LSEKELFSASVGENASPNVMLKVELALMTSTR
jgi:hypothetical protein